jgi:transposase-like protein
MVKTNETDYSQYVVQRGSDSYWKVEEKFQIVSFGLCRRIAITTLCRINNISPPLFYEWKDSFVARGMEGLLGKGGSSQKEIALEEKVHALERYIGELVLEKELLKKLKDKNS